MLFPRKRVATATRRGENPYIIIKVVLKLEYIYHYFNLVSRCSVLGTRFSSLVDRFLMPDAGENGGSLSILGKGA